MKRGILIFTFMIVVLLGISCAYAGENTTNEADLSAFESADSVEAPADDVNVDDSVTVNQTAADDDIVTVEENEKNDVLGASASDDIKSSDVAAQDDVLISNDEDILGAAPEDLLGANSNIVDINKNNYYFRIIAKSTGIYTFQLVDAWGVSSPKNIKLYWAGLPIFQIDEILSTTEYSFSGIYDNSTECKLEFYGDFDAYFQETITISGFTLPCILEAETTTTVTDITKTYNSGTFSVSGTVKSGSENVNGGTVTVDIGGTKKTASVSNGAWTASGFSSTSWNPGTQTITATYGGVEGSYKSSSGTGTLTINKNTPAVAINSISDVTYNSNSYSVSGTVKASGSNSAVSGSISLKVGTTILSGTTTWSGTAWTVSGISSTLLNPSTNAYTLTASFAPSDTGKYNSASGTKTFKVVKNTPAMTINSISDVTYNGNSYSVSGTVKASGSNSAVSGSISLKVGTTILSGTTTWSGSTWTVSGISSTLLDPSTNAYTLTASFTPSNTDQYNSVSGTKTFKVVKNTPAITVNDIAVVTYNGNSYSISGTAKASGSNSGLTSGTITLKTDTGVTLTGTTSWSSGTWYVNGISSTLLAPGTYTVTATYSSDTYYNSASASKSMTVNKMTPTVIVTGNPNFKYNINQGQLINGRISNSIDGQYGGHVNITIDGVLVKSNLAVGTDGSWSFTNYDTGRFLPNQTPYTITVSYSGNGYNYAGTGTGTYAVSMGDSIPLIVSGGDINAGDNKTVKVTVRDSKGLVKDSTVVLKGTGLPIAGLSLKTDSEGNAVFNVSGLATGYYEDWMVIVEEDERYVPLFNQTVEPFYVKNALNIIITNVDSYHSTYPDSIVITGKTNVNDNPVGSVNMTLGDRTVSVPLNNGVFTATFTGVIPGKYGTVNAVFIPDGSEHRYGGQVQDVQLAEDIIVDKFIPVIEIMNVQLTKDLYPGAVSVSFRLIGAENGRLPTGRVEAVFEGRVGNEVFVNSSDAYTISVDNLPEGTFNITLRYLGDDYYAENQNDTSNITILPDSEFAFIDNYYDAFAPSVVNVSSNMNGRTLMVYLDGNYYGDITVENDKSQIDLGVLAAGSHTVTVKFEGDESFTKIYESHVINVLKFDSILDVDINVPLYVDDMVLITVTVNETAGGYVSVNVNKKDYHLKINDHVARLNLTGLAYGTYTVSVSYLGDDHYNTNFTSKDFTISRYASNIVVTDIIQGNDLQINLTSFNGYDPAEVTGKLNITIGSITLNDLSVVDGKVIIPEDKLPALPGEYDAVLNYSGNYKFLPSELTTVITINKLPVPTIVPVLNVTIDDDLNITIVGNGIFTVDGNVTVKINDGESFVLPVVDGVFTIPYDKLPQAESQNNIKVSYANATYYENTSAEWSLHSDKITDYTFTISNDTIKFDENATLTIVLPDDVTATLTIKIDGVDKTVNIINGRGTLENISGLHAGLNNVVSEFGSGKYETSTATSFIQVNPNDITLTITVPDMQLYVDESATVTIQANVSMNNSVTLYVNGKAETVKLSDGVGLFTINPLVYGEYVFTAIFDGNENYTYATASEKSFSVDKINITLNVTSSDVVVGHDIIVNVNINADATGLVIVKVDNDEYSLNVGNKEYTLTVPGLSNGTHYIVAKYYGDSKYYGDENDTTVDVLKLAPAIVFSEEILIGDDFIISIGNSSSLVENPSGKLIFTIDGNPVEVDVVNGVATVKANDLPQVNDTYTATVDYSGDKNYYPLFETISFKIEKVPRLIITVPGNVTIDDEMVISVGDETTDGKLDVSIGGGEKFTVDVVNGTAVIPVKYLPQVSNIYAINIDYYNGSYWNDTTVVRSFHADKITDYPFVIINDTIKFDEIATLRFTLPGDVNTTLTVKIEDIVKTVKITDGEGVLSIANLHAGVNIVSTSFGNEKYETTTAAGFVRVIANEITLNITVPEEQLYVDQNATIVVQANVTMNNTVIVYINGEPMSLKLTDGKANFTIAPLVYGKYVFTAIFEGNENYTRANASMKTFNVDLITPTFTVSVDDILVDEVALVEVSGLPADAKGIVLIDINGTVYAINIIEGKGNLTVSGLKYGKYYVVANFTGDSKYYSNINSTSFDVEKNAIGEIKVSSEPIKDNKTYVTVTVEKIDATGEVIITTPAGEFIGKFLDGKTVIEVANLTAGENLFNITYVGDDKYLSNMTNGVIVDRGIFIESAVNVTADDIMVDGKTKFIISVLEDATGYVLLVVDGNNIRLPIVDAKAEFTMGNFKAGIYNVTVTYLGDDKYYYSTNTTSFEVCKYANDITVEVADGVAGSPVTINVIGDNADATGDVTITVDGVNYTAAMKDGVASFNVTVEKSGNFEVVAKYSGDDYYGESVDTESFDLANATVILNVTAEDIIIGDDAIIIVKLPVDATGNVTLSLRTTRAVYSSPIVDGVARFAISGLSAGTYYITADYAGDIKYAAVSDDNASFIVAKKNTGSMTGFDVSSDDKGANVTVNLPENATGDVTITVGDKVFTSPIANGTAVIPLGKLSGDTNVTISYPGDDVYGGFNETAVISAGNIKVTSKLTIEAADIYVGENANIVVSVPEDAVGNVVLNVNGKDYTVAISNGKAAFIIAGLGNGTHAVAAYFNGDEKYLKSENTSDITVNKVVPGIAVSADDINVGDATNIVVEVPTDAAGIVEITIGDKTYKATVSDGKAVFAIKDLANGTYAVSATYLGDTKYLTNSSGVSFNVSKNNIDPVGDNKSSISSKVIDNKTVITVDLPEDATGYVNITVDNKTYTNIPVVNGTASLPLDNISENANVSVVYSGDDKYDGFSQNATVTDDGIKLDAPIVVQADKKSYVAGDTAVIVAALPADATGKLIIKANGEVIFEGEGTAIVNYVVPAGGEFNIEASFVGDKKYAPVSNSIQFSADKSNSTASISVEDTPFDENVTVVVSVPADAKGNVTVSVNGKDYVANVSDGKAVFTLHRFGIGKYSVDAVYNGDAKYESSVANAEFDVVLKVVTSDIIWGENATVSVIAPNGTQGIITISCEKTIYVVDIDGTVMNFTFAGLLPGDHTVTVVYDRVDGYQATVNKVFNVARLASDVSVNVSDVIVGNDVVIHVYVNSTGSVDGGIVYVVIDGKTYNATVVNGTADIVISGLGVGKYENVTVTYNGTQFVGPSSENATFNVNVLPVNLIDGKNINVFYLQGAEYGVRVVDLSGKPLSGITVTFNVGGKTYSVVSDANGYAKLKLNLKPGSYKITVSANGKSVSNMIKVKSIIVAKKTTNVKKKAKKTIIKITVKGHKVKQTSKVKFTYKGKNKVKVKFGKDMKNQIVSVKFKGKTYKVKVNGKGVGVIKLAKKVAKKLKKGKKYTVKVTYKGPKLYKKVKLTIKFNGKKYKVKTNKLGVAKFKVTKKMVKKLKKGKKVKYTITYKQDTIKRFVKIK